MRIIKSEWHQVEKRYGFDIDEDVLNEIYPDATVEEIEQMLVDLENGDLSAETVINDAWDNDVTIDWDWLDEDDWWTDRKGGYDVTYEVIADTVDKSEEAMLKALQELKEEFERLSVGDAVDCFSCGEMVLPSELLEMDSQYICPHCHEGWVEPENREKE